MKTGGGAESGGRQQEAGQEWGLQRVGDIWRLDVVMTVQKTRVVGKQMMRINTGAKHKGLRQKL